MVIQEVDEASIAALFALFPRSDSAVEVADWTAINPRHLVPPRGLNYCKLEIKSVCSRTKRDSFTAQSERPSFKTLLFVTSE